MIQSIICDGKSGLLGAFPDIPVQMCQFHQIKIIVRHLTRKPKSPAAQALRALSLTLTEDTQAAFESALKRWYVQYAAFLNERSVNEKTGRFISPNFPSSKLVVFGMPSAGKSSKVNSHGKCLFRLW